MDQQRAVPNLFSGGDLDRLALERPDPGWLESARASPDTRYVVTKPGGLVLLRRHPAGGLALLDGSHPLVRSAPPRANVLLGAAGGSRRVLIEAGADAPDGADFEFSELRRAAPLLCAQDAALAAYARALTLWHERHLYCSVCGSLTIPIRAGHVLECTNPACRSEFFPRIDPAIIVLVSDGDHALLGRQSSWPQGRYSTLAGFVEPGESLEDAVRREVLEETGVHVLSQMYHSSQPWPFPSQLMLGFHAVANRAAPPRVPVDGELEEFRWFSRQEIMTGAIGISPPESISYRLITSWTG